MARCGADVAINYHTHADDGEAVAAEVTGLGRRAALFQADVSDRGAVEGMIDGAIDELGRLDTVVCNSYYSRREPFLELSLEAMRRTLEVTLLGSFHTAQHAARRMVEQAEGGHILFISSVLSFIPMETSVPYNTAKAGVNHMAATIAKELAPHRIRVNVIEPGWTDTPGERQFATEEELREGGRELPWGRLGTIEDLGKAAAFLSSDAADYITAATLRVDGGFWVK